MDELRLDGNAAAGVLGEVFSFEVTTAEYACCGCGKAGTLGAAMVYEVREMGIPETLGRIRERVEEGKVYVSFDVDFCDPAFAPGTGTPEVGGFTSREAQEFLRGLAGVEIAGCDVVEVYPSYDGAGQVTSLLAANVAYELLTLVAMRKKAGG